MQLSGAVPNIDWHGWGRALGSAATTGGAAALWYVEEEERNPPPGGFKSGEIKKDPAKFAIRHN